MVACAICLHPCLLLLSYYVEHVSCCMSRTIEALKLLFDLVLHSCYVQKVALPHFVSSLEQLDWDPSCRRCGTLTCHNVYSPSFQSKRLLQPAKKIADRTHLSLPFDSGHLLCIHCLLRGSRVFSLLRPYYVNLFPRHAHYKDPRT